MASVHNKVDFFETQKGVEFKEKLLQMHTSEKYMTASSYSSKSELYADNLIPFIDKHMNYIKSHPQLDPDQYLANLQIVTKIR